MSVTASQEKMALSKRVPDQALMPPPPATKRIKRPARVLEEDEYTDALSQIIARDFFPGLVETQLQHEYLNALDSNDMEWIQSARQRLINRSSTSNSHGHRTPGRRGVSFTTPGATPGAERSSSMKRAASVAQSPIGSVADSSGFARPPVDINMSLGEFQQKYTSEDNESFYKLLDRQNAKRAEKHRWMWNGNKIPAARQIAYRKREQLKAAARSIEDEESGRQLSRIDDGDVRPAMPDGWRSKPNNSLMFNPESIEDTHETVAQAKEAASTAPLKAVRYSGTRLLDAGADKDVTSQVGPPASPSLSAAEDAIAGRPRPLPSESGCGAATPRVNGYSFVDSVEPEPAIELKAQSFGIDAMDTPPSSNPFILQQKSKREDLHHRMVDKVAAGKRAPPIDRLTQLKEVAANSNTPRFMSSPRIDKTGLLTPAAKNLLGRLGSTPKSRSGMPVSSDVWDAVKTPKRTPARISATPRRRIQQDS